MKSTKSNSSARSLPSPSRSQELEAGDVGFVIANIKQVADARMGDTIIEAGSRAPAASRL